ncbi:MAG: hypothetical protein K2J66_03070 [Muribaculaceae bacterium]|nr:hypothetical protein [Muribaculaceae bacterium]
MDDWKAKLSGILAANPDMPAGDDIATPAQSAEKAAPKPRLHIIIDIKRAGKTANIKT